jgi:YD repeat-containing protein
MGLSHTAGYQYNDGANRLTNAVATALGSGNASYNESFTYDQYGNMTCTASPAESQCLTPNYNPSTNQINYITAAGQNLNYTYDLAGDLQ